MTPEEKKARQRGYRRRWLANPENRQKAREAARRWRSANREYVNWFARDWRARHPELARKHQQSYRAKRRAADRVRGIEGQVYVDILAEQQKAFR